MNPVTALAAQGCPQITFSIDMTMNPVIETIRPDVGTEAEQSILGALLLNTPETLARIEETGLKADDFMHARHGELWRVMAGMAARRLPVDVITVLRRCATRGGPKRWAGCPT